MSTATTQRRSRRAAPAPTPKSRSPMLLLTIAAIVVGVVIVGLLLATSGVLNKSQSRDLVQAAVARPADLIDGRSVGVAGAPIAIELWEDFQCPVCGTFSRSMEPRIIEDYVVPGKVRLTYHDLAFLGQESLDAAVGARAAEQLLGNGGFWRYHDLLFHNQDGENEGGFNRTVLGDMAVTLGMDRATFLAKLDDPELIAAVRAETGEGGQAGINSTPTFDINGRIVAGMPSYDQLSGYLDSLLASASPGTNP